MRGLSPLEAIQRRACVTHSTSIVKLEVDTVQAALSSWMVGAPCFSCVLCYRTHTITFFAFATCKQFYFTDWVIGRAAFVSSPVPGLANV